MLKLPQRDTKALLAIHGWSGILLGVLLYAVICTGVAAVFAEEINDWASPLAHTHSEVRFQPGIDQTVKRLAQEVDPQFHEEVAIFGGAGGRVNMRFHRHGIDPSGKPGEQGVELELDPSSWQILARREGWTDEIEAKTHASGIADFLVNLHVRLHIPDPYGLFVTGVLGLAMMIAAVTGILVHRHLFAELFTLRLGRDALLRRRDLHVVAGTWNLPFAIILAFTGSFFSFASSVGIPAIAMVQFGGDQVKLFETLVGGARPENKAPASLANLEGMVAETRSRNRAEPNFISIQHYGRADAAVTVSTSLPRDTLVYNSFLYDGVTGQLVRENPPLGRVPSMGASLVGLMYPLHFGSFAGAASKAVWVALGAAAAYVSLTGMLLWTRRREEESAWRKMSTFVHYVGYGLPLALACAPYAFFTLRHTDIPAVEAQDVAFIVVAVIAAAAAFRWEAEKLRRLLIGGTGIALIGLPAVRLLTGGLGWSEAWHLEISAIPAIDLALVVFGGLCLWTARAKQQQPAPKPARASRSLEAGAGTT